MDAIEQVKARLPIDLIIGETVALKTTGRGKLTGLCPFHSEKTPSFSVSTDLGRYYCFGCRSQGSVFDFVMQTQGIDFPEALALLAERAGVEIPKHGKQQNKTRDLYETNDLAQAYFTAQLAAHPDVKAYLTGRGFTPETIETWGFGYAPEGWTNLTQHARTKGVQLETLARAGLVKDNDGRFYDLYRNRVTIPIKDTYGRTVGFSARTLGDDKAKYVNTPETDVFHKGDLLFGLPHAKATVRDTSAAILVEGQFDVAMLHQSGYPAAVGAQSATLTEAQIILLERLGVTTLYMALDADEAGQRATLAGCDAVASRFVVKVVRLPGKDPAKVVQDNPRDFQMALESALSEPQYRVQRACEEIDTATSKGQRDVLKKLQGAMTGGSLLDPVAAEIREQVARKLQIPPQRLNEWLGNPKSSPPPSPQVTRTATVNKRAALRTNIAALVLTYPDQLEASCTRLRTTLLPDDPLVEFTERCAEAGYNVVKICDRLSLWDHVAGALEHLVRGIDLPLTHLERLLAQYARITGAPAQPTTQSESPSDAAQPIAPPVPVDHTVTPPNPTGQETDPIVQDDYEHLRHALSVGHLKDAQVAPALLDHYRCADSGDEVARQDIVKYLTQPSVKKLLHAAGQNQAA